MVTRILRSIVVLLSVFAAKSTTAFSYLYMYMYFCFWAGFAGYDASYAEFPLVVGRTWMLGILVDMGQKDRHAAGCFSVAVLGHAGDLPVFVNNMCLGFYSVEKLWRVPRLLFLAGRRYPCRGAEADSHGLPARKIMETPHVQYFSWRSMLLLWIRSIFGIFAMPSQCCVLVVGFFFLIMGGLWLEEQVPGDVR